MKPERLPPRCWRNDSRGAVANVQNQRRTDNDGVADLSIGVAVVGDGGRIVEGGRAEGHGLGDVAVIKTAAAVDRVHAALIIDAVVQRVAGAPC